MGEIIANFTNKIYHSILIKALKMISNTKLEKFSKKQTTKVGSNNNSILF